MHLLSFSNLTPRFGITLKIVSAFIVLIFSAQIVFSQAPTGCNEPSTYTYISRQNGSWTSASTWVGNVAPPVTMSGTGYRVLITHAVNYASAELLFQNGAIVTVKDGGSLTAKQIQMEGNNTKLLINRATLDVAAGNLQVKGNNNFFCAQYACIKVGENFELEPSTTAYFLSTGIHVGYNSSGNFASYANISGSDLRLWLTNGNLERKGGTFNWSTISAFRVSGSEMSGSGKPTESTVAEIQAVISPCAGLSLSGLVWNDVNANITQNAGENGTNTGSGLRVNLVNSDNTVIATTLVATNGTYSFSNILPGTSGLKLVLTNSATSITPGPLPTGWRNTGESIGTGNTASQTSALGQIELTTGTATITNQNFGIQQPPTAGNGTNSALNQPGNVQIPVPLNTFINLNNSTDPAPGIVTSIIITGIPTGANSIVINGVTYGSGGVSFPTAGVTINTNTNGLPISGTTITVDPTLDGATTVTIPFVAVDNGNARSNNTGLQGTAVLNLTAPIVISGKVFNDVNANVIQNTGESDTNAGSTTLTAYLVNSAGLVVSSSAIATNGIYSFNNAAPSTAYRVVLSNIAGISAGNPVTAGLPATWVNTGEAFGTGNAAGTGIETITPGIIAVTTPATGTVTNVNFGIQQPPTAGEGRNRSINPGGTIQVNVPANTFTNITESTDPLPGTVIAIRLTQFPDGATSIFINGTQYYPADLTALTALIIPADASGLPSWPITADPAIDGETEVNFYFKAIDNANKESANTGLAKLLLLDGSETLPVTLVFFTAEKVNHDIVLKWVTSFEQNNKGFAVQHSNNGVSWADIQFVKTQANNGNSNQALKYNYTHTQPASGKNFYRLKQTDFDGKHTYSEVRTINADRYITVSPNPAINKVTISGVNNNEVVNLTNLAGQVIKTTNITSNTCILTIEQLPVGIYFITITNKEGRLLNKQKIIKK